MKNIVPIIVNIFHKLAGEIRKQMSIIKVDDEIELTTKDKSFAIGVAPSQLYCH